MQIGSGQVSLRNRFLRCLLLGTGGTISGLTHQGGVLDAVMTYQTGQVPVQDLYAPQDGIEVCTEQVAQIDSKDMDFLLWERLLVRCRAAMRDASVDAIVIAHGTDTMEETAYFLEATLACTKPVILTGAMRPANAPDADGPKNLNHAFASGHDLKPGVWVSFAGHIYTAQGVQKNHPQRLNAFAEREVPKHAKSASVWYDLQSPVTRWPRVEIISSHTGVDGSVVDALMTQHLGGLRLDGLVVACTGNGTMHHALQTALYKAFEAGIAVTLASRVAMGGVIATRDHRFTVSALSPVKARIQLILDTLKHEKTTGSYACQRP